jgi:hypothetical protein
VISLPYLVNIRTVTLKHILLASIRQTRRSRLGPSKAFNVPETRTKPQSFPTCCAARTHLGDQCDLIHAHQHRLRASCNSPFHLISDLSWGLKRTFSAHCTARVPQLSEVPEIPTDSSGAALITNTLDASPVTVDQKLDPEDVAYHPLPDPSTAAPRSTTSRRPKTGLPTTRPPPNHPNRDYNLLLLNTP